MALSAGSFRYSIWDPWLIASQILSIQSIFYFGVGSLIALLDSFAGQVPSISQIFWYPETSVKDVRGRIVVTAFALNSLICAVGLWQIVQRTKQCLDFTLTAHGIHLLACWAYNGMPPTSATWWVVQLVAVLIMCVSGEFLCMRTEMKSIPVALAGSGSGAAEGVSLRADL